MREAEGELRKVREGSRLGQRAARDYWRQAQRLTAKLSNDVPKATALLEQKITTLQSYVAMTAPAAVMPSSAPPLQLVGGMAQMEGAQWLVTGPAGDIQKLRDGLTRLDGTAAGHAIAAAIQEQGTAVQLGQTGQGVVAHFDPDSNEIVIDESLRDASPNVLAAHLAHEGTHVQWGKDDSIEQEYQAFKAQAEVWDELKGSETDPQCDWVTGLISLGEREAKKRIRMLYPDLPEHT